MYWLNQPINVYNVIISTIICAHCIEWVWLLNRVGMMIGLLILLLTYSWYIIPCVTSKYNISIMLILILFIGIFTIVPETQYVYLNHNVTFECATNLTGYTLTFVYGGSADEILKQTNLPDGSIKVTTTFIVTTTNNGTSVSCIARLNSVFKGISDLSYVYVQGKR